MGNIGVTIKRFLGNKNTVTIIGVVVGIAVLYFGYNWRVNQAVQPVTVPCAKEEIPGNTLITTNMLRPNGCKVPKALVDQTPELVRINSEVIGKYVSWDTTIPEGSLIYKRQLKIAAEMPNAMLRDIPEGYTVFALPVTLNSTFGNSIMPENFIDLYFKALDDNGLIIFGRFIESIQVLAVKDQQGHHVFSSASRGIPSELVFAVPDEYHDLLMRARFIRSNNIEILPVPRNASYSENPGETQITSTEIREFINAKSITAQQNVGLERPGDIDQGLPGQQQS